jgi:hypothetical protein
VVRGFGDRYTTGLHVDQPWRIRTQTLLGLSRYAVDIFDEQLMFLKRNSPGIAVLLMTLILPFAARAESGPEQSTMFGLRLSAGGRFDNVRKCVASSPGTKGGPAADVSAIAEVGLTDTLSLVFNLPVMRPILFATAFKMLQFEPDVTLILRRERTGTTDLVFGPSLGLSLHYGPDYTSENSGSGRKPSFFALGPMIGLYIGLDFRRPQGAYDLQLGVRPYVTPLFAVDDPENHRGVVAGGMLEGQIRFGQRR